MRLCGYSAEVIAANMGLTICHTAFVFCVLWTKHLPGFYLGRISQVTTERKSQSQRWSPFPSSLDPCCHLSGCWQHTTTCFPCCLMPFWISYCLVLYLWSWILQNMQRSEGWTGRCCITNMLLALWAYVFCLAAQAPPGCFSLREFLSLILKSGSFFF